MDTRFWGPSGWRLLHTISFGYRPAYDKKAMKIFFETLPFVLPCKFCRSSLTEYMNKLPLGPALHSKETLSKWLWKIHNEVNAKLRSQDLPTAEDPPFSSVEKYYTELLETGCTRTEFPGWDFLFSIADFHPMARASLKSVPMAGAPHCDTLKTIEEKNQWNCLKADERLPFYKLFWLSLGLVLPFQEWRQTWNRYGLFKEHHLATREETMKWLWSVRCSMEKDLELLNRCNYSSLCKTLQTHRSGCSQSKRARTCRKSTLKKSKTTKQRW